MRPLHLAPAILALAAVPAFAQDGDGNAYVEGLRACQTIADGAERLACYDRAVGAVVAANDGGELRVVDKAEVAQTRRKLFGFSLPDIGLFGGKDTGVEEEAVDMLETTITGARRNGDNWVFTTQEGATWEINNPPSRLRPIRRGDSVVFKKASLGSYFIRIEGQLGVKGRRVG